MTIPTLVMFTLWAAIVGAFRCMLEAMNGSWALLGIAPPPVATRMSLRCVLSLPLAYLLLCRLTSTRRPLALLDISPILCVRNLVVRVRVPLMTPWVHLPNLGPSVLLK